ncbi:MAG: glutamate racemase [Erythrobacter sp.]|uniref:glutamate racemase n=1 Tax=Erythrobacter sp. TaxID=1042 RepID=UPI0026328E33|nr:glutamate racemase [Erythrobacter sp.]MDJ0977336.1 glutamate racemase [Erythrobacter sp.]
MIPSSPVLLFDSGVGGLTVYDALREALPAAPVIYTADYAGIPYGKKTEAEVAARVAGLLGRMAERWQPRLACIACNTASTIALGMVREVLEIPIVGTVPAIKPAAGVTSSGAIALVGTAATIRQPYVDDLESRFASDKRLVRIAAPDLVELAEAKLRGRPVDLAPIKRVADQIAGTPSPGAVDTIVLACTHFPLLTDEFAHVFGSSVTLVDGAQGIARRIAHLVEGQSFAPQAANRFVVTGPVETAAGLEAALAERGFGPVESFNA